MLIKALKSTLSFFKQHFCENPSKLANLADFVSQKKKTSFFRIFQWKYRKKKKNVRFLCGSLWPHDLFFSFYPFFLLFMWSRVKACYFLDHKIYPMTKMVIVPFKFSKERRSEYPTYRFLDWQFCTVRGKKKGRKVN